MTINCPKSEKKKKKKKNKKKKKKKKQQKKEIESAAEKAICITPAIIGGHISILNCLAKI